jgi:protein-S-isoprenylcysteine O-methyltransferase Ste14
VRVVVLVTVVAWGVVEMALRLRLMLRPGRARVRDWASVTRVRAREWTFFVIVTSLAGSVILAGWVTRFRWAATGGGRVLLVAGEALIVAGAALRVWAMLTLDRFFTFVVGIADDHRVVEEGPYRVIRHPGYAGAIISMVGVGVALRNWLAVLLMLVVPPLVFAVRIRVEEATLVAALGEEYRDYARRTGGLVPRLWRANPALAGPPVDMPARSSD